MKRHPAAFAFVAGALIVCSASAQADPIKDILAKFSAAWDNIRTYECTIAVHEVKGRRVQDRVYRMRFSKPLDTRMDILKGDGRGSAAVWHGGEQVHGHQGGILSAIKLNVDIHSRLATSMRGTTVAQANFGALLRHLRSLDPRDLRVTKHGGEMVLTAQADFPPPDADVTKEVYIFGSVGLPVEYFQYADDKVVKHVAYSDFKVNIEIPASAWQI